MAVGPKCVTVKMLDGGGLTAGVVVSCGGSLAEPGRNIKDSTLGVRRTWVDRAREPAKRMHGLASLQRGETCEDAASPGDTRTHFWREPETLLRKKPQYRAALRTFENSSPGLGSCMNKPSTKSPRTSRTVAVDSRPGYPPAPPHSTARGWCCKACSSPSQSRVVHFATVSKSGGSNGGFSEHWAIRTL